MGKILNLVVYPTSRCDTGCNHCMDDCNMNNPQDLKPEMAQQIVDEVKKRGSDLVVLFTGYGEPLLTPNLVKIVETFGSYEKTQHVGIVTSGFSDKNNFRKAQFEDLLNGVCAEKLGISQSFSLFHPSFPERLKNIIELMINNGKKKELTIKVCLAVDNCKETWETATKTITEISNKMGLEHRASFLGWLEDDREKYFFWVQEAIGDSRGYYDWVVDFETHLIPQWHFIAKEGADDWLLAIEIQPILFEKVGRGKKLSNISAIDLSCGALGGGFTDGDSALTIFPDGIVCSECCHKILYGKIGKDSIFEMDRRKDVFVERLRPSLLADKRMFDWMTADTCRICQNLVAERGIELK
ncbi:MAG: radical SAM protein [Candidatus Moraniibacteriota bacterium]